MKYTVTLFDPVTNRRIESTEDYQYDVEGLEFYWSEGNYACDCNRALLFNLDRTCSEKIILEKMVLEDGRILFLNNEHQLIYKDGEIIGWRII